jgi:hypothetical protein
MCLIIDRRKHPLLKPIKLRKDKIVWKELDVGYKSLFCGFKYRRGKTYTNKGIFAVGTVCRTGIVIREAFHAFRAKGAYEEQRDKFVIPAGSLVYYGVDGEICSDTIRFPRVNE